MRNRQKSLLVGLLFSILLSGCTTTQSTYYWGNYEQLIHDMYMEPGSADPVTQIQQLTDDIQIAREKGQRTPPGVHAHLGYMYSLQGNTAQAKTAFLQEKALYPESADFIDGMLKRAYGGQ